MSSLDAPLNDLHDQLEALQRTVLSLERDYRALAERDDLAVYDLGDEMTPGECIARISGRWRRYAAASTMPKQGARRRRKSLHAFPSFIANRPRSHERNRNVASKPVA
ncbi:hypothetical protein VZC37_16435 [Gordonia sp. LSe1-13]|uniref:Uncharacterized protein n=1 Tax=Gordonia sesuvii TaxID=3116777 RepID=A0ABU7MH96_9ACTN|nr:hypothetical protein [Gordonia sp. LSe1-13]